MSNSICAQVKIDYQPRAIKVKALQEGDYLELLNLFPLEGVHLTLKKLLLTGVSGWDGVAQLLLQVPWMPDNECLSCCTPLGWVLDMSLA